MSSQEVPVSHGPDRQRMLNVLAQRRYRQRKRERLLSLETRLKSRLVDTSAMNAACQGLQLELPVQTPQLGLAGLNGHPLNDLDSYPYLVIGTPNDSRMCIGPSESGFHGTSDDWSNPIDWGNETSKSPLSYVRDHVGVDTILPSDDTTQSGTSTSDFDLSAELQDLETSQFTFHAESAIDIPIFKTTQASLQIAQMLGLTDELLNLTTIRVLDVSKISMPWGDIPENLRPTQAQLSLPHHAIIDLLPWPSVRTKLICIFSQPDELRPPIARGSMAIMRLVHDLDDESEGLRITSGRDGCFHDGKGWEIGQAILKDWWWALDPDIVSNSNRLRRIRGASHLQLSLPQQGT